MNVQNEFVNLLEDSNLKIFLADNYNRELLKYFLKTFGSLPDDFDLSNMELIYRTIINDYIKPEFLSTSDLIIKSGRQIIVLKTYQTQEEDFVVHIMLSHLDNEMCKLREIILAKNCENQKEVIANASLQGPDELYNSICRDYIQIKKVDLSRLKNLDNTTSINRWLKFIAAQNYKERLIAQDGDELLKKAYI